MKGKANGKTNWRLLKYNLSMRPRFSQVLFFNYFDIPQVGNSLLRNT